MKKIIYFLKYCFRKSPTYKLYVNYLFNRANKGRTKINILQAFPGFVANGYGSYKLRSKLTILSINQIIPAFNLFVNISNQNSLFKNDLEKKINSSTDFKNKLGKLFKHYGSDKSTSHDYQNLYGEILSNSHSIKKIFEIGLGTNNTDIVSTMGRNGKPGASLRAFRDACENAVIIGADFDERILFNEERINCFFVDQTDLNSFEAIKDDIGDNFDLMIDDGLHAPNANLHSLNFFISKIKIGGYAVIEDIDINAKQIWNLTTNLLPSNFLSAFIKTKSDYVFIVKRIS